MSTETGWLLGQPWITGHGEAWPFNHVTPITRLFSVPLLTLLLTSMDTDFLKSPVSSLESGCSYINTRKVLRGGDNLLSGEEEERDNK